MPSCSSGLGFFLFSSFCLVASTAFSCNKFTLVPIPIDLMIRHSPTEGEIKFITRKNNGAELEATSKQKEEKRRQQPKLEEQEGRQRHSRHTANVRANEWAVGLL
jgi:hypothetical protein